MTKYRELKLMVLAMLALFILLGIALLISPNYHVNIYYGVGTLLVVCSIVVVFTFQVYMGRIVYKTTSEIVKESKYESVNE